MASEQGPEVTSEPQTITDEGNDHETLSGVGANSNITKPIKPASRKNTESQPSTLIQLIRSIFGFRKTSLTFFVLLTYLAVFLLAYLSKLNTLHLPANECAILDSSWLDLQYISSKPHPYDSHANDEVHAHILKRVEQLSSKQSYITYDDDQKTKLNTFSLQNDIWSSTSQENRLIYFESSNIVVKIEGSDPTLPGVLLSAHFDSVPSAYGTTDDGTGIASLLGILEHYSTSKQPLRTIVLNFNDNEEFGLLGAYAFLKHPWFKLVDFFINLEGTGTGERAILFRATDYEVAKHYKSVRSPFASSIYQQGFASGLVHSETDYRIYAPNGLRGFDIAFRKPRSLYHTQYDNIRTSSKNALWHMLSSALDLTESLSNAKDVGEDSKTPAVFFDILGITFIVLPLPSLYIINIVLLVIVPITALIFGSIIHRRKIWFTGFSWLRFPISFILAISTSTIVAKIIYYQNPLVVSRDYKTLLLTISATFVFVNYIFLTTTQHFWPVHDLKLIITLEVYVALWLILLITTISEKEPSTASGEYIITILYTFYSVSIILGLFSISVASPKKRDISLSENYRAIQATRDETEETINENQTEVDETVPLVSSNQNQQLDKTIEGHPEHNSFTYDWSLQFLILVPINFLISYLSVELIFDGLNQTVQEGSSSNLFVFSLLVPSSVLLTIPLISFAYKLNFLFAILLIGSITIGGFTSLFEAPFSSAAPLKVRFLQTIDLDSGSTPIVEAYSREGFVKSVLEDLPSVKSINQSISCVSAKDGQESCYYESKRPYLVDSRFPNETAFDSYLDIEILKRGSDRGDPSSSYSPLTGEIAIKAKDNRNCDLTFNTTTYGSGKTGKKSPLRFVTYFHDEASNSSTLLKRDNEQVSIKLSSGHTVDSNGNEIFKWLDGIDVLQVHKLSWNQSSFHLGFQWIPKWLDDGEEEEPVDSPLNKLGVSISCFWGEYDDVSIIGGEAKRKIPAYDELLQYSPDYISWSNLAKGLVRIDKYIEL